MPKSKSKTDIDEILVKSQRFNRHFGESGSSSSRNFIRGVSFIYADPVYF